MGTTSFIRLNAWKKAHEITPHVCRLTRGFPEEERFGLVAQMRRAAVSIPANIAEGHGRRKAQDKARFCNISEGSAEELKYFAIPARDLGCLKDSEILSRPLDEVSRMLRCLCRSILDA